MLALVTGASGFIGGHVAEVLLARGHRVRALVRPTSDTSHLTRLGLEIVHGDLTDRASLGAACRGVDCVFHTAAVVASYGGWETYRRVGVMGTENLVDAAAGAGIGRFLHLSSIAAYGFRHRQGVVLTEDTPFDEDPEPWNHYVREKVISEKIVWRAHEARRLRATVLRPSVVLGPRDRNTAPRMLRLLQLPVNGLIGWGNNRVPCVVVEELAELALLAAESEATVGRAYNVSGLKPVTQRQLVGEFARAAGRRMMPFRVPLQVALLSSRVLEEGYELAGEHNEPFASRLGVVIFGNDSVVDCTRATAELGWNGTADYFRAIRESVAWYQAMERE